MKTFLTARLNYRAAGQPRAANRLLKPVAWLLLAAMLSTASGCARHASLQKKTRWYKSHSSGKATPCPCGH